MIIQYLGRSCFKLQTKGSQGEVIIAIDPFHDGDGLKMPHFQADIVTVSHDHSDHNNTEAIRGELFVISTPGEYETKDVMIYGIQSFHDNKQGKERGLNTIFKIISENINLVHLGDLGENLSDETLDKLGNVDILLIPVGGTYTIDAKKAAEVVSQIEPRIVIPMHYKMAGEVKIAPVNDFLKACGLKSETLDKLKVAKKDLQGEETRVIVLEV